MQDLGFIDVHYRMLKVNDRAKRDTIRKCHNYAYNITEYRVLYVTCFSLTLVFFSSPRLFDRKGNQGCHILLNIM